MKASPEFLNQSDMENEVDLAEMTFALRRSSKKVWFIIHVILEVVTSKLFQAWSPNSESISSDDSEFATMDEGNTTTRVRIIYMILIFIKISDLKYQIL